MTLMAHPGSSSPLSDIASLLRSTNKPELCSEPIALHSSGIVPDSSLPISFMPRMLPIALHSWGSGPVSPLLLRSMYSRVVSVLQSAGRLPAKLLSDMYICRRLVRLLKDAGRLPPMFCPATFRVATEPTRLQVTPAHSLHILVALHQGTVPPAACSQSRRRLFWPAGGSRLRVSSGTPATSNPKLGGTKPEIELPVTFMLCSELMALHSSGRSPVSKLPSKFSAVRLLRVLHCGGSTPSSALLLRSSRSIPISELSCSGKAPPIALFDTFREATVPAGWQLTPVQSVHISVTSLQDSGPPRIMSRTPRSRLFSSAGVSGSGAGAVVSGVAKPPVDGCGVLAISAR
mmetsp:Transcript_2067/g.5068  ORF Transcript_2067/g.5068 Transcript_2067/m.5068 type:complete len:346 (-) Transcript_2067:94-1131(-)